MKIRKIMIAILEISIILVIVAITVYNIIFNCSFWKVSIAQILTLIIAIGVAFFASQYKTDERKQKEHTENLVIKIQKIVLEDQFVRFSCEDDTKTITVNNRRISNAIDVLKEYSKRLNSKDIKDDTEYIENEFKQYRMFVEEKIGDLDYLSKSESILRKYSENISSKCDALVLHLYL